MTVEPSQFALEVGQTRQLAVTLRNADGNVLTGRQVTWRSSAEAIATVDGNGLVRGIAGGQATITATSEGKSGQATVTVTVVPVARVELSPAQATIAAGDTVRLSATARTAAGATVQGCAIAFSSANEAVARVAASGTVTGVAAGGPVTITATANCGAAGQAQGTAQITVTVPRFVQVVVGEHHGCGLLSTGAVLCWGGNEVGQIGDGTTSQRPRPVPVAGGLVFQRIGAGNRHTCGLTGDGRAHCWGRNNLGQLGDGTTIDRLTPTPVVGGPPFTALGSPGGRFTCALTAAGAAFCWGSNGFGMLGDGTMTMRLTPTPVAGGHVFASLGVGGGEDVDHMCGVTTAGTLLCWGFNFSGELGDGTNFDRLVPTPVAGGRIWSIVGLGEIHSCGVTTDGLGFCWGGGLSGGARLGIGDEAGRNVPTAVVGGLLFSSIVGGEVHTCGLTRTGAAYCWGVDDQGQLGTGTIGTRSNVPVAVVGGHAFTQLTAGEKFSCGLRVDGEILCWGDNLLGQLGNGAAPNDSAVPVRVLR